MRQRPIDLFHKLLSLTEFRERFQIAFQTKDKKYIELICGHIKQLSTNTNKSIIINPLDQQHNKIIVVTKDLHSYNLYRILIHAKQSKCYTIIISDNIPEKMRANSEIFTSGIQIVNRLT